MKLRATNLERLREGTYDVLVLGGGINGAVSAACLAARGAKVALIDRVDFAGVTSQQSSNLAWGGIKYMESFELGLVNKLCKSRNELMRAYPSTVQEIRFFTTHERTFRHGLWKLVLGTWLYWLFGRFFTHKPRRLSRATIASEEPIVNIEGADGGIEYSDAYFHDNDARFVWGFIRTALDYGAACANYVESLGARREGGEWLIDARDTISGARFPIRAKVLINACGPYVDDHNTKSGVSTTHRHVFSKGIHLIVPRVTESKRVLTFFADDGRLFFVIPLGTRTSVGTTDTRVDRPETWVTPEDRQFVLENINKRLNLPTPLTESDVIAERCGVRPLVVSGGGGGTDDWLQLSRKHEIEVDPSRAHISIFGGKLTDCLNVGQEVFNEVSRLGITPPYPRRRWYGESAEAREEFFHQARLMDLDSLTPASSSEKLSTRLWRRYGRESLHMLDAIRRDRAEASLLIEDSEYVRCEISQASRREMVTKLSDFLRRRSKIAQVLSLEEIRNAPGLRDACKLMFGAEADAKMAEYFEEESARQRESARQQASAEQAAQPSRTQAA
ncbi:MAG: FAD-dependent oxidoreductase [Polyangiaceae bacterium]